MNDSQLELARETLLEACYQAAGAGIPLAEARLILEAQYDIESGDPEPLDDED
jgi:hypothetical protein